MTTDREIALSIRPKTPELYWSLESVLEAMAAARSDERSQTRREEFDVQLAIAARRFQHAECVRLLREEADRLEASGSEYEPGDLRETANWLEAHKP